MYQIIFSKKSHKSLKKLRGSGQFDETTTRNVINTLASGKSLDLKYKNHRLQGKFAECFECHVKSNLLLIYQIDEMEQVITIIDIGTHSELFE